MGFEFSGDFDIANALEASDYVISQMLDAMADVHVEAQKAKGLSYGVHRTGLALESIKKGKPKRTDDGGEISITFGGTRIRGHPKTKTFSKVRNAEVAFINEYGAPARGIMPRPFIRDANEECADEAVEAAENVFSALKNI